MKVNEVAKLHEEMGVLRVRWQPTVECWYASLTRVTFREPGNERVILVESPGDTPTAAVLAYTKLVRLVFEDFEDAYATHGDAEGPHYRFIKDRWEQVHPDTV